MDPESSVKTGSPNDVYFLHGEMSWSRKGKYIVRNTIPTIVPGMMLLLYVPGGPDPQFRPLTVSEYFRPQGYNIADFNFTEIQVRAFLSETQAISLPGRSFQLKCCSACMVANLGNRRIKPAQAASGQ